MQKRKKDLNETLNINIREVLNICDVIRLIAPASQRRSHDLKPGLHLS